MCSKSPNTTLFFQYYICLKFLIEKGINLVKERTAEGEQQNISFKVNTPLIFYSHIWIDNLCSLNREPQ